MEWHSFFVIIALLSGLLLILLAYQGWMRRYITGMSAFVTMLLLAGYWSLIYAAELANSDLSIIIFLNRLKYIGIAFLPVTWLLFAVQYTGRQHLINRYRLGLLLIIPFVTQIMVWTNYGNMFMASVRFFRPVDFAILRPDYGVWFWVHAAYSHSMLVIGLLLLLHYSLRMREIALSRLRLLVLAGGLPFVANLIYILNPRLFGGFDVTLLAMVVSSLLLSWGLLRLRLIDVVPIAYDTVMHHLPDGLLVLDNQQRISLMNPTARQYLQAPDGELVGLPLKEALPHFPDHLFDLLKKGEAITTLTLGQYRVEARLLTLYDGRKRRKGQALALRDITPLHQIEIELGEQLQQMAVLAHLDDTLLASLDIDELASKSLRVAVELSQASAGFIALADDDVMRIYKTSGAYAPDLRGQPVLPGAGIVGRVFTHKEPELVMDVQQDADYVPQVPGTLAQITIPLQTHEQIVGILNLECDQPGVFDENRYVLSLILSSRIAAALETARLYRHMQEQLGETQALNEKLQNLEQIKTDMIRIASHDLRNPLAVIQGFIDVLKSDHADLLPQHVEYLEMMERSAARMNAILEDILSMERIESMAQDVMRDTVEITAVIRDAAEEYRGQAENKNQKLLLICPEVSLFVWGDAAQLREAITNLIGNAIKYTPEGGQVTVTVERREQNIYLEVQDTGYGIPDDLQLKLFQPFYRARTPENAHVEGTGLGLHLVKNIIQRHNGTIDFQSQAGVGSKFFFSLPLKQVQQVARSTLDES